MPLPGATRARAVASSLSRFIPSSSATQEHGTATPPHRPDRMPPVARRSVSWTRRARAARPARPSPRRTRVFPAIAPRAILTHVIPERGAGMTAWRRVRWITLMLILLTSPLTAGAQQPSNVHRIGVLAMGAGAESAPRVEPFVQGLRELGYVEGRNIAIEYRWAEGRVERLPGFAAELVVLKVDVIVATASPAALAAKGATRTIPIVFVTAADPVDSGLVASIARPGGNVTGLSLLAPEITARQLQLLKEAVPKASRVAVLSNPANSYTALLVKE